MRKVFLRVDTYITLNLDESTTIADALAEVGSGALVGFEMPDGSAELEDITFEDFTVLDSK